MWVYFKPKTRLGKWSAWLIVAFAVCVGAFQAYYASLRGPVPWYSNLVMALALSPALPLGVAAFVTGLISIVRRKERSIAVGLAVVFGYFGLFGLIVWIRLVTFPH
jgi:hypothetical protein